VNTADYNKQTHYYLVVPFYHWMFFMLLIRAHLLRQGVAVTLICDEGCAEILKAFNLKHQEDYLSKDELDALVSKFGSPRELQIISHGHGGAMAKLDDEFLKNPVYAQHNIVLSIFCDGAFNDIIGTEDITHLVRTNKLKTNYVISFGQDVSFAPIDELGFSNLVIPYAHYDATCAPLFNNPDFKNIKASLPVDETVEHVVVIALKPWGDPKLRRYAPKAGLLTRVWQKLTAKTECSAQIYADLINRVIEEHKALNPEQKFAYWIRPDIRAWEHTLSVADKVRELRPQETHVIGESWPGWVTLDYLLVNLKPWIKVDLSLLCFDSGAGYPFSDINYLTQLFVGAPRDDVSAFNNKKLITWCKRAVAKVPHYGLDKRYRLVSGDNEYYVAVDFRKNS